MGVIQAVDFLLHVICSLEGKDEHYTGDHNEVDTIFRKNARYMDAR